ncbi:MAG: acetate--CoA ligase [Firmicutes bacterium]|mgnify:CR=1 FL=1|nr:acetate--CoA ligase [Bacillota bacterium]
MSDLKLLFSPRSIAVIGASKKEGKIGHSIMANLRESGFTGQVYPINLKEKEILGFKCYPSIKEVPEAVDVAVIAVPAELSVNVAQECGEAGVKFLVVITAGFKEVGEEGLKREQELVRICKKYNMRMVGPNVVGILDTHTPFNASFTPGAPPQGKIAFISQSGAMLLAILDWSRSVNLGFSRMISMGNKADLNEVDFIWAASEDPQTSVILCYLEDVTDGERFLEVVREASKRKPIIILKAGTSQAGARAASSHTGALAGSNIAYDTAFRQCGVLRAENMADLFDLAIAFVNQPIPKGKNIAIITNSGGPGIIATDSVERENLEMAKFSKETTSTLRDHLPPEASVYNPVDVLGDAPADRYRTALEAVLADESTQSALVLLSPTAVTEPVKTAELLVEMRQKYAEKPLFASYMGGETLVEGSTLLTQHGIPTYTFPEPALKAISGMVKYSKMRKALHEAKAIESLTEASRQEVKATFYDVLRDKRLVLLGNETTRVAEAYGIPVAPIYLVNSPEEAVERAEAMGYPVVLKIASPKIIHKTDVGGVKVGLESAQEVRNAYLEIMESVNRLMPGAPIYGIEVQKMMPKGNELIIGMTRDLQFGPLIAFGMGGIYVNLLKDVSFRLAKGLTVQDIEQMITETKAYTLLRGYRGSTPSDIPSIVKTIARVAQLSLDFPEIAEMDLNPVIAYPDGAVALDVKITISYDKLK